MKAAILTVVIMAFLFLLSILVGEALSQLHVFAPYGLTLLYQVYLTSVSKNDRKPLVVALGAILGLGIIYIVPYGVVCFMSGCIVVIVPVAHLLRMRRRA